MAEEKTIFITGGASGIGRAVALYFGQRGWFTGLADINRAGMEETAQMLPKGKSSIHMLDVRKRSDWENALEAFCSAHGGQLNVLFNNAGVGIGGTLQEHSAEDIDTLVDVNFRGVIVGAHVAWPWLRDTPGSCLLNTASASAIYGTPGLCVYSATKFGVRGLSEALDAEWHAHDIRVRALLPSFIDTPLLDRPGQQSNMTSRERVIESGMEISLVEMVAEAAWNAVHDDKGKVHYYVGKTAHQMAFASRWMPKTMRKRSRQFVEVRQGE